MRNLQDSGVRVGHCTYSPLPKSVPKCFEYAIPANFWGPVSGSWPARPEGPKTTRPGVCWPLKTSRSQQIAINLRWILSNFDVVIHKPHDTKIVSSTSLGIVQGGRGNRCPIPQTQPKVQNSGNAHADCMASDQFPLFWKKFIKIWILWKFFKSLSEMSENLGKQAKYEQD